MENIFQDLETKEMMFSEHFSDQVNYKHNIETLIQESIILILPFILELNPALGVKHSVHLPPHLNRFGIFPGILGQSVLSMSQHVANITTLHLCNTQVSRCLSPILLMSKQRFSEIGLPKTA